MAIPNFDANGNLPQGIYLSNWPEITAKLAFNSPRQELLAGLKRACKVLRQAGCNTIYIDGSYATNKEFPGDFDVCWNADNVDLATFTTARSSPARF